MTKIIGLTGGIGSGKTTIANFFLTQGVPIYIADDEAKKMLKTKRILQKIVAVFGTEVLQNDSIDRSKLASLVFNDREKLQKLNDIIHPAVAAHFKKWLTQHKDKAFVIKEAAILFESGSYANCDKVISVVAPLATRILRVVKRDNISEESVKERIKNQWTDEQRIAHSDYVIENIDLEESKKKCLQILKDLRKEE